MVRCSSLWVVLDDVGVAGLGVVGIEAELLPGASLAEEVPAAVELDVNRLQPFVAVRVCIGALQRVLLGD